jgi:ribosomal protein S24E
LAVLLKVELDKVWVRSINTKTGTRTTVGLAHVYKDPGQALIVEPEYIIQRNQKPEAVAEPVEPEAKKPEAEEQESEKKDA